MFKQNFSQKLQQNLSPLQIQQIKLLELTTLELEDRIDQELEENPALEKIDELLSTSDEESPDYEIDEEESLRTTEEDLLLGDYRTEDDIPDYKLPVNYSNETKKEDFQYNENESLHEYLMNQLGLRDLSSRNYQIGQYIIGNIDEDGYLRRDPAAISNDLAFQQGFDPSIQEISAILEIIKAFDPPGVAASNLQECLLLQIKRKETNPIREMTQRLLEDLFIEFSKKQYDKVKKSLSIDEEQLMLIKKEIFLLNPRPGSSWENTMESKMTQITPDFIVEVQNGQPVVFLFEAEIPELRISQDYVNMFNDYSGNKKNQTKEKRDALIFVKQKIDSAKWFIDSIKQRQNTLIETMKAIVSIQSDFFVSGEESDIKPMILKDVAELSGFDISTISRVSNSKYVQTHTGIYSLKYFFSEALHNVAGEEISIREIKTTLQSCIDEENKMQPMTDGELVTAMKQKGYDVARRTIAKYREQLNIPVARLRKEV